MAHCGSLGFAPNEQNIPGDRRVTRLAFSRRIPGLKRETWGTHRVSRWDRFEVPAHNESDPPVHSSLSLPQASRLLPRHAGAGGMTERRGLWNGIGYLPRDRVVVGAGMP